jgi:hypothetical protein
MFKRHRRLIRLATVALLLTAFGGAVAGYGYTVSDWGCLSPAELERPLTTSEVRDAFDAPGFNLQPARVPVRLPAGARAYRHETNYASIFVVIYGDVQTSPDLPESTFRSSGGVSQWMRHGIRLLNIDVWLTDSNRRSAQHLAKFVNPVVEDLDRAPRPGDHCYIG